MVGVRGQIALPAQAGTCLTQYGLVLEAHNPGQLCVPPGLAPFLALDTWGQNPYIQVGKGGECWGGRDDSAALCDIQCGVSATWSAQAGLFPARCVPCAGLVLGCESQHAGSSVELQL